MSHLTQKILKISFLLFLPFALFAQSDCSEDKINSLYNLINSAMREEKIAQEKINKGDMSFQTHFDQMMREWEEATEITFSGSACLRQQLLPKLQEIPEKTATLKTFIEMLQIYQ